MMKKYYYIISLSVPNDVCVCLRILSILVSADSPLSTVTPLSLISNIQSKRTSALKTNTNHTCYETPLPIHEKKHLTFSKLKIWRKMSISICIEIPLLFHCPSWRKKKLNKIHPEKKHVESNSVTGGTAVPCTVRITANCCGWIIAISANYGGAGLFVPASWANEGRTAMNAMVNLPPPQTGYVPPLETRVLWQKSLENTRKDRKQLFFFQ